MNLKFLLKKLVSISFTVIIYGVILSVQTVLHKINQYVILKSIQDARITHKFLVSIWIKQLPKSF